MARITNYPFNAAYTHLIDMYGIEMNEDDFESIGFVAWLHIGNKVCRTYRTEIHPTFNEKENKWEAPVPCNCDIIEAITVGYEDAHNTSAVYQHMGYVNRGVEESIEVGKYEQPFNYQSGTLVHYEQVGDMLYFREPYTTLNVLYKGVYLDEDGLPYLNFKEVDAIACYCAFTVMYKKALKSMDGNATLLAAALLQQWMKKCSQARTPEYLNQNEMNHILDAKSSWNRKVYGVSFKADMR